MNTADHVGSLVDLIAEIRREFPDFELIQKSRSGFMKLLNVLLLVITFGQMRTFMTAFTTTIGCKVYIPDNWTESPWKIRAEVLRHERVHMRQKKKWGFLFYIAYLFLPVPVLWAYCRTKFEMEAYEESMRARIEYYGLGVLMGDATKQWFVGQFTGASYFWMWVGRKRVEAWYDEASRRVLGA